MESKSKVVPIRRVAEDPASQVQPVARKISGTMQAPPRALLERLVRVSVDKALEGYAEAQATREAGDREGAAEMSEAAGKLADFVGELFAEIAAL